MPVYEFTCNACGAPASVFVRSINSPVSATCERCGSADLRRVISRFAVLHGSGSMGDLANMDPNDPRAMAMMMRQMRDELGDEASGPEFDEMLDRMERGDLSSDEMAALGDDGDDGGFDDAF
jgi:putative FmdB family regulatory protein